MVKLIIFFLLTTNAFALVEYDAINTDDSYDVIAISKSFDEINEYATKHGGGMIFQDKDSKEYTFLPSKVNLNGRIYYYTEDKTK